MQNPPHRTKELTKTHRTVDYIQIKAANTDRADIQRAIPWQMMQSL